MFSAGGEREREREGPLKMAVRGEERRGEERESAGRWVGLKSVTIHIDDPILQKKLLIIYLIIKKFFVRNFKILNNFFMSYLIN